MTKKQKRALYRVFKLVDILISNGFNLKERSIFYNVFNAHLLKYNTVNDYFEETDIEKEIQNRSNYYINIYIYI